MTDLPALIAARAVLTRFDPSPVVVRQVYTFTPHVAWECPRCKAMNAPTTERCNCKPAVTP